VTVTTLSFLQKCKNKISVYKNVPCFPHANQHIRMISGGSCDTED